jgi:hypothetical protein
VFQIVDFSYGNDLKFTYVHLQFQKNFPGIYPRTPMIKGRERKGGRRKGEEGRGGRKEGWDVVNPGNKSWLRPWMHACMHCQLPLCQIARIRQPVIASPTLVINLIKPLLEAINKQFSQDFSHYVSHFSIF